MLKEADLALISTYKIFAELSSIFWWSMKGVISRDSVKMVPSDVDFGVGSYLGVLEGSFSCWFSNSRLLFYLDL